MMDISIVSFMESLLRQVNSGFHRYLYGQLDWDSRMFGIIGPRGVGKSTMMLQYIKEHREEKKMMYISADHVYFSTHTLLDSASEFVMEGGEQLFIDEIHKYNNWSRELKLIYDAHPELKVVFTGSSVLDIYKGQADLSRRAPVFLMQGLSFREFLLLFHHIEVPLHTLGQILSQKVSLGGMAHPLSLFQEYLRKGYYPFASDTAYEVELQQVVNQTMEVDIPQFANMTASTARKLRKLLVVISKSVPFKPVMGTIAAVVGVSRNVLPDYFLFMEQAGLIAQLRDDTGGVRGVGKVEKVYIDNTSLAYLLGGQATDVGNIRETFFYNQMRVTQDVICSRVSDFEIDGTTFEVGGKNKGKKQIHQIPNSYVVKDNIEYGAGNILPLWAFGLTY